MNMDIAGFEQRVRERAYYQWENEGRPMGRHVEHWLGAEEEMRAQAACVAEAAAQEPALGEAAPEAIIAAPKPARAKKAAAPKAKAAAVKKKPAVSARRGATAPEMSITLQ